MRFTVAILSASILMNSFQRQSLADDWLPKETLGFAKFSQLDSLSSDLLEKPFPKVYQSLATRTQEKGFPFASLTLVAIPGSTNGIDFFLKFELSKDSEDEDIIEFFEKAVDTELEEIESSNVDFRLVEHFQKDYVFAIASRQVWIGPSRQTVEQLIKRSLAANKDDNLFERNRRLKMCLAAPSSKEGTVRYCELFLDVYQIEKSTGILANAFVGDNAEQRKRLLALSEGVAFYGVVSLADTEVARFAYLDAFVLTTNPRLGVWRLFELDTPRDNEQLLTLKTPGDAGVFVLLNVDPQRIEEFGGQFLDEFVIPDGIDMSGSDLILNMLGMKPGTGALGQFFYSFGLKQNHMTLVRGTRFDSQQVHARIAAIRNHSTNLSVEPIDFEDGFSIEDRGTRLSTLPVESWILSGEHAECLRLRELIFNRDSDDTLAMEAIIRHTSVEQKNIRGLAVVSLAGVKLEDALHLVAPRFLLDLDQRITGLEKANYEGLNFDRRQRIVIDELNVLYQTNPPTISAIVANERNGIRFILCYETKMKHDEGSKK